MPQQPGGGAPVRPLDGIRVLDLTSVLMGPFATQALADYGADVIKVESPGGDLMRHAGHMRHSGMGPIFLQANRNKRSIVIDLKQQAGRDALLELARSADMLVHNVRPAAMDRLGLGYARLRAVNERLLYLALVGFDQRGPYATLPAYDDVIQGSSGLASLLGEANGGVPAYVPLVIADRICGINAAKVAMAALFMRERTGRGQAIEVPMFETMVQIILGDHLGGETYDPAAGPMGYSRLLARDRRPYRTRDGYISLLVYNDGQWQRFFEAIGERERFDADPRFTTAAMRAQHYDEAYALLAERVRERSTQEWLDLLRDRDIPCMSLHDLRSLLEDAQLNATGFFEWVEHPTEGRIRLIREVAHWGDAEMSLRRHAPRLGEHSEEVLREAGLPRDRVDALLASRAVVQAAAPGG